MQRLLSHQRYLVGMLLVFIAMFGVIVYADSRNMVPQPTPTQTVSPEGSSGLNKCLRKAQNVEAEQTVINAAVLACREKYPEL